jgi:hypothetical protein
VYPGSIEWPDIGLPDNYSFRPRKCNEGYDGLFKANTAVGHTVRFPSPMNVILVVVLLWPLYRLLWPSTRLRLAGRLVVRPGTLLLLNTDN